MNATHWIQRSGVFLRACAPIGSLLLGGALANPMPAFATEVNLDSRVYNLCVRYNGTTLNSDKCTGGDTGENWTLLGTGQTGRYALENAETSVCLLSSGTTLYVGSCNTSSSNDWWTFSAIAGTNGNQNQLINASGYCLSNDSSSGLSGGLSAETCNANYWTQQWKQVGSPETDRTGNTTYGPWIGHSDYCTDHNNASGTCDSNGKWLISDACEGATFLPIRGGDGCLYDSQLCALGGSCLWENGFTPVSGTSTYMYSQIVDKINHRDAQLDSAYVSTFFEDTIVGSLGGSDNRYLNNSYVLEVRIRLNNYQLAASPVAGHARITIGVLAVNLDNPAAPKDMYMEVVVWRDSAWYDMCTATENTGGGGVSSPCDTLGIYDRRSAWGTGEQVWYTASQLNAVPNGHASVQAAPSVGGGWISYQVPVTALFTAYRWTAAVQPSDWSKVLVEGVYIGSEQWGNAMVNMDLDKYRFYEATSW